MSVEGENARKKADKMLEALHKYNSQILGDDLEDSIIERINNAKELKDILDKARAVSYTHLTLPTILLV